MIDSISFDVPTSFAAALIIVISIILLYLAELHKINRFYQDLKAYDLASVGGYVVLHCNGLASVDSCVAQTVPPGVKYRILTSPPPANPALCGSNYTYYVTPIYSEINGTLYLVLCEPL